MARARNIKPKFFQNDELGELDPLARLLFIGMWTIADFKGCIEYRPKRLKAQLLAYDECRIEELVNDLDKSGFIAIYSVLGQQYIKIVKFVDHQNPHKNERDAGSDIPDIEEKDNIISQLKDSGLNRDKDGTDRADSLFPLPSSLIPLPSTAGAAKVRQKVRADGDDEQFQIAWSAYPKRPGASRADAFKAWQARLREGVDPVLMTAGAQRYAEYVIKSGTEPQYIKQPATFFGPGAHFTADWTFTETRRATDKRALPQPSRHSGFDTIDYSEGIEDGRIV